MLENSQWNNRCIWYCVDKFRTVYPNFRDWTHWDIWRKRSILRIFYLGSHYWRDRSKWLFVVLNLKVSSTWILDYWETVPTFNLLLACTQKADICHPSWRLLSPRYYMQQRINQRSHDRVDCLLDSISLQSKCSFRWNKWYWDTSLLSPDSRVFINNVQSFVTTVFNKNWYKWRFCYSSTNEKVRRKLRWC